MGTFWAGFICSRTSFSWRVLRHVYCERRAAKPHSPPSSSLSRTVLMTDGYRRRRCQQLRTFGGHVCTSCVSFTDSSNLTSRRRRPFGSMHRCATSAAIHLVNPQRAATNSGSVLARDESRTSRALPWQDGRAWGQQASQTCCGVAEPVIRELKVDLLLAIVAQAMQSEASAAPRSGGTVRVLRVHLE